MTLNVWRTCHSALSPQHHLQTKPNEPVTDFLFVACLRHSIEIAQATAIKTPFRTSSQTKKCKLGTTGNPVGIAENIAENAGVIILRLEPNKKFSGRLVKEKNIRIPKLQLFSVPSAAPLGRSVQLQQLILRTKKSNNPIIMGKLLDNRGKALRTCDSSAASFASFFLWNSLKDNYLANRLNQPQFFNNSSACGRLIANTGLNLTISGYSRFDGNIAECRIT